MSVPPSHPDEESVELSSQIPGAGEVDQLESVDQEPETLEEVDGESALDVTLAALTQRGDAGANWFFWIAGLSLVNTAMIHSGAETHFVVGMGITLLVDAIAHEIGKEQPEANTIAMFVAIGFSVFCSLIAILFGWLSRRRILPLYALGMFIYLLDGLLFLLFQDWMSLGFHAFALFCMWGGFSAYRTLGRLQVAAVPSGAV